MPRHFPLLVLLLVYLFVGMLYARLTPAWQSPDEPAHYNYVRQLAAGNLPVMEPGDYDQDYLTEVVFESGFAPEYPVDVITYEDWQPPLYYLVQTPVFIASSGSMAAMRRFSLLLGAGVIVLAYALVLRLAPDKRWLALTVAVFIAFLPQHLAIMASINNDALAELLIAALLYLLIDLSMPDTQHILAKLMGIGLLLGLGFLTKGSVYSLFLITGLVLLWRFRGDWKEVARAGLLVFMPALLLGLFWWGRNVFIYGGLDVLGKQRHDAVVVGQPRTAEWIAQYGLSETIERFVQTTFNSFWGQFGWMTVPMTYPPWLYPLLWAFSAFVLAGFLAAVVHERKKIQDAGTPVMILVVTFLLTLLLYAGYNLQFVQHQGRYLFPALIPIAIALAISLGLWSRPLQRRWPWFVYLLPIGLGILLVALDLYALFFVILPALA